jgi:hypothetical protein
MRRRVRIAAAALLGAVAFASNVSAAELAAGLRDFLATYRCGVVEALESIHVRGDRSTETDRFAVLQSDTTREHYVQCIFTDNDAAMYCEAASGYHAPEETRFQLAPSEIAVLKRLGFATDVPKGNFYRTIDTKSARDISKAADLILSTLYEVYGVRGKDLRWADVPLTPEIEGTAPECVPLGWEWVAVKREANLDNAVLP